MTKVVKTTVEETLYEGEPEVEEEVIKLDCDAMIIPFVDRVIFNPPYTIVNWSDGTKTIVKPTLGRPETPLMRKDGTPRLHKDGTPVVLPAVEPEEFDEERGLSMALVKKIMTRGEFTYLIEIADRQNYPEVVETDSNESVPDIVTTTGN